MRRAPIVLGATAAGLAGVLGFHTSGNRVGLVQGTATPASGTGPSPATSGSSPTPSSSSTPTTAPPSTTPPTTAPTSSTSAAPSTTTAPPTTTTTPAQTRVASGAIEQTMYGNVGLQVTITGNKITKIVATTLSAYDARSQYINTAVEPMLTEQALAAQSANIQGVSGASYTSAAYVASLQSALAKLGFKR